jgi:hypothetical protein
MNDSDIVVACHCKDGSKYYHIENGVATRPLGPDVHYVDPYECPDESWDKIESNSKLYVISASCPVFAVLEWDESSVKEIDWNENAYQLATSEGREYRPESYNRFAENLDTLLGILHESWRVLENGGKVIFPTAALMIQEDIVAKIQHLIDSNSSNKWEVSSYIGTSPSFPNIKIPERFRDNISKNKNIYIFNRAQNKHVHISDARARGIWPPKLSDDESYIIFTKIIEGGKRKTKRKTRKHSKTRKLRAKK